MAVKLGEPLAMARLRSLGTVRVPFDDCRRGVHVMLKTLYQTLLAAGVHFLAGAELPVYGFGSLVDVHRVALSPPEL